MVITTARLTMNAKIANEMLTIATMMSLVYTYWTSVALRIQKGRHGDEWS